MQLIRARTASIDVDPQKGFTPLLPKELPVPNGDEIVPFLNKQAELASLRIGTKDWHPSNANWIATEEKPQFSPLDGKNMDIAWNAHCIAGTKGAEFLDGLPKPEEYDFFVWKGMERDMHPYGSCYHDLEETLSTGLIEFLRSHAIEDIIVGGLATDYCVKTTAMQLKKANFNVIVNLAACRGIAPDTVKTSIDEMKNMGIVVVEDIMKSTGNLQ